MKYVGTFSAGTGQVAAASPADSLLPRGWADEVEEEIKVYCHLQQEHTSEEEFWSPTSPHSLTRSPQDSRKLKFSGEMFFLPVVSYYSSEVFLDSC